MATFGEPLAWLARSLHPQASAAANVEAMHHLNALPLAHLQRLLVRHRVTELWGQRLSDHPIQLSPALQRWLSTRRSAAIAQSLLHYHSACRIGRAFDAAGIRHVFFKGQHLARLLYTPSWLRSSLDIDLLVDRPARSASLSTLRFLGFDVDTSATRSSHEMALSDGQVSLDLHWQPWRPGRARFSLTPWMLGGRQRLDGLWVPDENATTLLLLVHTALTEQVTGRLLRLLDVDRWLRQRPLALAEALPALQTTGCQTAAWAVLWQAHTLWQSPVDQRLMTQLAPRRWRRFYLQRWLQKDPGGLYQRHPHWVRGGFNLFLQDSGNDMLRSLLALQHRRRQIDDDMPNDVLSERTCG